MMRDTPPMPITDIDFRTLKEDSFHLIALSPDKRFLATAMSEWTKKFIQFKCMEC